jgi:TonB-dependent receptor
LDTGTFRSENNLDKEKTAHLDLSQKYVLGDWISGDFKFGGKYKYKNRFKEASRTFAPYFLNYWQEYTRLPDGTYQKKNFNGTWFEPFYKRYLANVNQRIPSASDFLDASPESRDLFEMFTLKPLVNRDALRLWYDLNKNGNDANGRFPEYAKDNSVDANYYNIVERVGAGYVMNTLNFGQLVTFIAGLRVESESNNYHSRFAPTTLGGFPTPSGTIKDTSSTYKETIWLPNFNLTVRPVDFLHIRFAAYKAIARPAFNARLEKFVSQGGATNTLLLGNNNLRASKAWNYEINTSVLSNTIGLISFSAFYKDISDMFHFLNSANTTGNVLLDTLGIRWRSPFGGSSYAVTVPYNSSKPTKVWGFEFEHQANLSFLPGYLQYIVLSYNASIIRSETSLLSTTTDTTFKRTATGFPPPDDYIVVPFYSTRIVEVKQKLEGQPEFYGNISLGYDIGGFSARLSLYYQGEFNRSFSADGRGDRVTNAFSRLDLTVKQKITDRISVLVNLNNLTDTEEKTTVANRVEGWRLPDTNQRYGVTGDVGVRLEF